MYLSHMITGGHAQGKCQWTVDAPRLRLQSHGLYFRIYSKRLMARVVRVIWVVKEIALALLKAGNERPFSKHIHAYALQPHGTHGSTCIWDGCIPMPE